MPQRRLIDSVESAIPGWYGKIPALGDFASRRLPPEFLTPWEDWLMTSLRSSRAALSDRWRDTFLQAPIWRFLLFPDVCGPSSWAGILMPNVDNVGRHYPLTIALSVPASAISFAKLLTDFALYPMLEDAARSTLDLTATVDEFEHRLSGISHDIPAQREVVSAGVVSLATGWQIDSKPKDSSPVTFDSALFSEILSEAAAQIVTQQLTKKSFWWTQVSESSSTIAHAVCQLPPKAMFTTMLGTPKREKQF
jgi:type VI secretion system protein ImpM